MTTTTIQRPETIRLADALKRRTPFLDGSSTIDKAEKELRCQHAEIARLTYENEALKAKNQPLLIHVIADMADGLTVWSDGKYVIDDYLAFARAIEAAHGIGEKT